MVTELRGESGGHLAARDPRSEAERWTMWVGTVVWLQHMYPVFAYSMDHAGGYSSSVAAFACSIMLFTAVLWLRYHCGGLAGCPAGSTTAFPSPLNVAATWSQDAAEAWGTAMGKVGFTDCAPTRHPPTPPNLHRQGRTRCCGVSTVPHTTRMLLRPWKAAF